MAAEQKCTLKFICELIFQARFPDTEVPTPVDSPVGAEEVTLPVTWPISHPAPSEATGSAAAGTPEPPLTVTSTLARPQPPNPPLGRDSSSSRGNPWLITLRLVTLSTMGKPPGKG